MRKIKIIIKKVNKEGKVVSEELGHCWEYTGLTRDGYGIFSKSTAHQMVYKFMKGEIQENMCVMHICDNRICVNPDHLKLGTNKENIQDMKNKKRCNPPKYRIVNCKLSDNDVIDIRKRKGTISGIELAKEYDVSDTTIYSIWNNQKRNVIIPGNNLQDDFYRRAIYQKITIHEQLGECWETKYGKQKIGYNGKCKYAHRISYSLKYGEIPEDKVVRHKCDNNKCINPTHLELGTQKENMQDIVDRDRVPKGENHCLSKLTDVQVIEMRKLKGVLQNTEIAKQFNIHPNTVGAILNNKTWKHLQ